MTEDHRNIQELLRQLPSVDEVLGAMDVRVFRLPYKMVKKAVRQAIAETRSEILNGASFEDIHRQVRQRTEEILRTINETALKTVINGTGIVLHTGLGRAPLSRSLIDRVADKLTGYVNIELNTATGKRGERMDHINDLLCSLTGAESSLMVNNNAAAVLIMLNTLAFGREVIISRGQQVEIGGSFRIPDVILKSGCKMVEVGTTNKTHLRDYEDAVTPDTAAILVAHTSNYKIQGFTQSVPLDDLARLCRKKRIHLLVDLGSGALANLKKLNLPHEPQVREFIKMGAGIVTFSGDKLLGGPQAGILCGKKSLIRKIHKNPMYRALRCDKIIFSLMEESLRTYYKPTEISRDNLALFLLTRTRDELHTVADRIVEALDDSVREKLSISVRDTITEAGSGSLPAEDIPSVGLFISSRVISPRALADRFRKFSPPVLGYMKGNRFVIDLKAVLPEQTPLLISAIREVAE